jgi:SAM-dependent methyltransferase
MAGRRNFSKLLVLAFLATTFSSRAGLSQERNISQAEAKDITRVLEIGPGDTVADVGAGYGGWTLELSRKVGNEGQVYATEVDGDRLEDIREIVTDAEATNVSVIWGSQWDTGLPPECCNAILLRRVYHHFTEPEAMRTSLRRALRPEGVLLVVDFAPKTRNWLKRPKDVPKSRDGHGIDKVLLIEEMLEAGFEIVKEIEPWHGRDYSILFRLKAVPELDEESP